MKKWALGIRFWVLTATTFSLFVVAGTYSHVGYMKYSANQKRISSFVVGRTASE
ncbi:hypothetical protein [Desulfocicer vacuolatum]|uniref:hypothetical protein n=1 Tax=Desulfocicer vacuolatum TaxID=2298 RepID=UPI00148295C6|nr:hypothetical protein [Desulfocicer vacuolatum]